jgi:hypothetical protein
MNQQPIEKRRPGKSKKQRAPTSSSTTSTTSTSSSIASLTDDEIKALFGLRDCRVRLNDCRVIEHTKTEEGIKQTRKSFILFYAFISFISYASSIMMMNFGEIRSDIMISSEKFSAFYYKRP